MNEEQTPRQKIDSIHSSFSWFIKEVDRANTQQAITGLKIRLNKAHDDGKVNTSQYDVLKSAVDIREKYINDDI